MPTVLPCALSGLSVCLSQIAAATTNKGGGKAGLEDRKGGRVGHARYSCNVCRQTAPDMKSMQVGFNCNCPQAYKPCLCRLPAGQAHVLLPCLVPPCRPEPAGRGGAGMPATHTPRKSFTGSPCRRILRASTPRTPSARARSQTCMPPPAALRRRASPCVAARRSEKKSCLVIRRSASRMWAWGAVPCPACRGAVNGRLEWRQHSLASV